MDQAPLSTVDPLAMWATAILIVFVLCAYGIWAAILKPLGVYLIAKWKDRKRF
jgi:hypothetical protein